MPAIEAPPISPQAQAQMGPPTPPSPGGPNFGPGIGQAMQQQGKHPAELAVNTVEKILMGVQDPVFQNFVKQAIAILRVGEARAKESSAQSGGAPPPGGPPGGGAGPKTPLPPSPGQLPG